MYFVYLLVSLKNDKIYVGCTAELPLVRLEQHNLGSSFWTKQNRPFKLVYYESYYCKKDALHRELFLKSGVGRKFRKLLIEYYSSGYGLIGKAHASGA
ncbi:MAG: GIY-YIG nuclease family protein [Patescibacteria group bacterium]